MSFAVTTHGSVGPTAVSSITQSVVVSTNGSTLIVFVGAYDGTTANNTIVTAVTYNGVALTRLNSSQEPSQNPNSSNYTYVLQNVAAQTANLVITFTGTCSNPTLSWAVISGAATSGGVDNHTVLANTQFNATTGLTASITPVASGAFVWSGCDIGNGANLSIGGTNQTALDTYGGGYTEQAYVTNPVTGSVNCTYQNGTTTYGDIFLISLAPAAAAHNSGFFAFM